ncbi:glycosyltransferase [Marinimicrobium alkaliphilum]|uniref:glycosyltransferase n=1 Tax=Marinimicrobium alkaliphilum TaxID=2202654 RepID=UPI000DB9EC45|nr:glycosyltransferase [Marinimicrobium alkaliphilum]
MYPKTKVREMALSAIRKYLIPMIAILFYLSAPLLYIAGLKTKATKLLLASIRYRNLPGAIRLLLRKKRSGELKYEKLISPPTTSNDFYSRAIILSMPEIGKDEQIIKGVMLVTFTHTFSYLLHSPNWPDINKHFLFVLEPSSSGYADPEILLFIDKATDCIVQCTEPMDRAFLQSYAPEVTCLDIGSGNWVDHELFNDRNNSREKQYDAIYIANLNPVKRVYRVIKAMAECARKREYRGAILCAPFGSGSIEDIKRYVQNLGMEKSIEILPGTNKEGVVNLLASSKCSLLASLKEGSSRVISESMFCNTPVICLSENIGVNKSYINEQTGLLVSDHALTDALLYLQSYYELFSPREWALRHISPEASTDRVRATLLLKSKGKVNSTLRIKTNSPEVEYQDKTQQQREVLIAALNDIEQNRLPTWPAHNEEK